MLGQTSASNRFEVPPAIVSVLGLDSSYSYEHPDTMRALSRAKHDGFLETIPQLAAKAITASVPVEHQPLIDRLTMLGMSMMHGKDAAQIQAWLYETARLLGDLPEGVLFDAIDDCVKEPGRVFVPSVGEIRERASAALQKQERRAARLNRLAKLIEDGAEIPDWEPPTRWGLNGPEPVPAVPEPICTPEQAAAILKEYGLPSSYGEKLAGYLKPEPHKSRAEWVAEGKEPPPIVPTTPDTWTMPC